MERNGSQPLHYSGFSVLPQIRTTTKCRREEKKKNTEKCCSTSIKIEWMQFFKHCRRRRVGWRWRRVDKWCVKCHLQSCNVTRILVGTWKMNLCPNKTGTASNIWRVIILGYSVYEVWQLVRIVPNFHAPAASATKEQFEYCDNFLISIREGVCVCVMPDTWSDVCQLNDICIPTSVNWNTIRMKYVMDSFNHSNCSQWSIHFTIKLCYRYTQSASRYTPSKQHKGRREHG